MRQELVNSDLPTPTQLRMRIAETGIRMHRVAALLGISDGHLSNVLRGHKDAKPEFLGQVRDAIEQVAATDGSLA